ncbi:pyridoxal phosphate-dependent transferase [Gamsiella multidivaricata]|uniref:pyridoxal phosphate-dependent transferase n=1 Tax=Gamsiella multidivaricata TaxID=101098 RepID=UPI00221F49A6|nr:pyridoxal phosphate-dependent transferase [Gamsiella multidivaricata]KAI7818532.1 pyridoxal phosphate-dependent transferase [Gamsiella multidivaricata]
MSASLKAHFLETRDSLGYGYSNTIDTIRKEQYPQLKDAIYLDHAGATLPAQHLLQKFTADLTSNLYANPHSKSPSSQATSARVESARRKVLEHFKASIHGEWDVIFTANATAGIKLVGEAFPWTRRSSVVTGSHNPSAVSKMTILREAHTSLVGLRGLAHDESGTIDLETVTQHQLEQQLAQTKKHRDSHDSSTSHHPSPPLSPNSSTSSLVHSLSLADSGTDDEPIYNLFAYPAQCNFGGRRFPLSWPAQIKSRLDTPTSKNIVLLDAASYVMTSELDLSDHAASPDFVVVSFYKMFGFPTGLGAVIVKTELAPKLRKKYFGGGTVSAIASDEPWQVYRSSLHGRYEDGTLNYLDIVALDLAFESIREIYGSYSNISPHVTALHRLLYRTMKDLKHYNGAPLCDIYVDSEDPTKTEEIENKLIGNPETYGPILNFNLRRSNGSWIGYGDVERLASMKNIHVRTGGFCNPGSMQRWLGLSADEVKKNLEAGHVCWDDTDILNGKPTGSIRISLGAMSTVDDVLAFIAFLEEYFIDNSDPDAIVQSLDLIGEKGEIPDSSSSDPVQVDSVIIYPIKSCRGYKIPRGRSWPLAPHGLLYDREWMLVDEVTGAALTQKRYPRMCMIRAEILLDQNLMIVEHDQEPGSALSSEHDTQKKADNRLYISLDEMPTEAAKSSSRVCGDCTSVVHYTAPEINEWFTRFLGKPCRLARQPVTSQNPLLSNGSIASVSNESSSGAAPASSRFVKSHLNAPAGAPILLSNESPFLLIADKSVERVRDWVDEQDEGQGAVRRLANLSEDLDKKLRHELTSDSFRANFVTKGQKIGFEEDHWSRIQIGDQVFDILGPCRRCHMVTIDQMTAMKNSDVFLALSKNRKSPGGQIFFGMHMLHRPDLSAAPYVVKVGDMIRMRRQVSN